MSDEFDIPHGQRERNQAFLDAVRTGRTDIAAVLARADPLPADATEAERERWRPRRRLYRPRRTVAKEKAA